MGVPLPGAFVSLQHPEAVGRSRCAGEGWEAADPTGHAGWISCAACPAWPGEGLQGPSVLLWCTVGGVGLGKYAHVALFTQHLVISDS